MTAELCALMPSCLLTASVTHVLRQVVLVRKLQVDFAMIECSG